MNIIMVSHPSRGAWVSELQKHLPVVSVVYDTVSAHSGHRTALQLASVHTERVIIMEDDAIPVEGFIDQAQAWCKQHPDDLLSFYLGTSRPVEMQAFIECEMQEADRKGEHAIWLTNLIHGVCYSIPPAHIRRVLDGIANQCQPAADYAIGKAWGRKVCYPIESLVQHRDGPPVERHPDGKPRTQPRVARRLAGPLMFNPLE